MKNALHFKNSLRSCRRKETISMAIYHFNTKTISRGKGQSATASSAYRSGEKLYSERYGKTNYYVRQEKPVTFILKPDHAPKWTLNRERLWNEVEKIEKQHNSQLAREFTMALPNELSNEEQLDLAKEFVKVSFIDEGMVADVAIHRDDKNNPHIHVMTTLRPFKMDGSWGNKQEKLYIYDENGEKMRTPAGNIKSQTRNLTNWNSKDKLYEWRKNWADITNKYLEENGSSERISEKSYAELGEDRIPTIHEGYVAREMDKRGEVSERIEKNKAIRKVNYEKQKEQKERVKNETSIKIVQSYSPKEKIELKQIAKNLKVFIDYDNLLDKERMVGNWERAEMVNEIIRPDSFDPSIYEKIDDTKESIKRGKELVEAHSLRIYEKYYPELQGQNFTKYGKINIGRKSLEEDRKLTKTEILEVLNTALNDEVIDVIKTVSSKNYAKSVVDYERQLSFATKKLDQFYNENEINKNELDKIPAQKKSEFTMLFNQQDFQKQTIRLLEKTYDAAIKSVYPTANLTHFKKGEKEELAKAIDYYGNTLSYAKLVEASQEKFVSKYTTYEQRIGVRFIHKVENGTLTNIDMKEIESDYRKREIFDTISDPSTKKIFLDEVANNKEFEADHGQDTSPESLLGKLMKNTNIYEELLRASQENARRANADKKQTNRKAKSVKSTKKKQRKSSTPSI